jgi:hypothetical protein
MLEPAPEGLHLGSEQDEPGRHFEETPLLDAEFGEPGEQPLVFVQAPALALPGPLELGRQSQQLVVAGVMGGQPRVRLVVRLRQGLEGLLLSLQLGSVPLVQLNQLALQPPYLHRAQPLPLALLLNRRLARTQPLLDLSRLCL